MTLYGFLIREGAIPTDWFAAQVAQADRTDGDIDTLSNRIAHIRTWTFAANRPDWLADPEHWQDVTRAVEDKLSDALHERLTERFIDRRTSVLMRRLRENALLEPEMSKTGEVVVEGHTIGRLDGFVFVADASSGGSEAKALQNAAQKALAGEIATRAARLAEAPDEQFVLAADGTIRWTGAAVGKLIAGEEALRPRRAGHRRRASFRRAARGGGGAARRLGRNRTSKNCLARCSSFRRRPTSAASRAASRSSWSRRSACSSGSGSRTK